MAFFPQRRMRRLRATENLRSMVRENHLRREDMIYPLFVMEGNAERHEIGSMPGCFRLSIDQLVEECKIVHGLGIPAVILFGIPDAKDAVGSGAYDQQGIVQRAVEALRKQVPDLTIVTDVCLCEYTDHGHCGPLNGETVENDATLKLLADAAVSHAKSGAQIIAPSDMMDGRVAVIRQALDDNNFSDIPIMSYAAKFASAYYGPFRDAADCAPQSGDRKSYQMDPANEREAAQEILLDVEEGADIIMVKPALAYLDIIRLAREICDLPIAAYNVSGEYSMIKNAAAQGLIDEQRIVLETLTGMKRAGADIILTYHAKDVAGWLE